MNRIPILATGAVLASLVLCGGAVTVANAVSSAPVSQVLQIAGVSTTPTATPSAAPTFSPAPSPSVTAAPGDDKGVTVVKPSDPTKIGETANRSGGTDGKGCAHLGKHDAGDPTDQATADPADGTDHQHWTGTPVPQDPDPSASPSDSGGSDGSGSHSGTGGGKHHGGGTDEDACGSTAGTNGTVQQ
ncbi:MAG: hypothetical protein M3N46_10290 [Actinomycetota bacterium]|nr:hypothetical protein [Actinomycetota bacterium]